MCRYGVSGDSNQYQSLDELSEHATRGDVVTYMCGYADTAEIELYDFGTFIYGEEEPPGAPLSNRAAAQALLDERINVWLPLPTLVAMPSLDNQRVGFESWFGLPTFGPPGSTSDVNNLIRLSVPRGGVDATITVTGRRGQVQTFPCPASGLGPDNTPNGDCRHRFNWATTPDHRATVAISYDITFTSVATGEIDVPLGTVTRTSEIPLRVRDLQATAN